MEDPNHPANVAIAESLKEFMDEAAAKLADPEQCRCEDSDFGFSKGRGIEIAAMRNGHEVTLRVSICAVFPRHEEEEEP